MILQEEKYVSGHGSSVFILHELENQEFENCILGTCESTASE